MLKDDTATFQSVCIEHKTREFGQDGQAHTFDITIRTDKDTRSQTAACVGGQSTGCRRDDSEGRPPAYHAQAMLSAREALVKIVTFRMQPGFKDWSERRSGVLVCTLLLRAPRP